MRSLFFFSLFLLLNIFSVDLSDYMMKPGAPRIGKIPKVIHQIWVGKKNIPPTCQRISRSWQKNHPDWEYKLWTDADIESFPWIDKESFLKATNPGMKSDIWRYQILCVYGGIYVDIDFECLKNFSPIHDASRFYSGFMVKDKKVGLANALIGAEKNHPILKKLVEGIRKKNNSVPPAINPRHSISVRMKTAQKVIDFSGPSFFTKVIQDFLKENPCADSIHLFPSEYFYPLNAHAFGKIKGKGLKAPSTLTLLKDAYALHYYARSWQ